MIPRSPKPGVSSTWVTSQWKFMPFPGHFSAAINSLGLGQAFNRATKYRIVDRSEEHTSELQSLMRLSYAVFCFKKKKTVSEAVNQSRTNDTTVSQTHKPPSESTTCTTTHNNA